MNILDLFSGIGGFSLGFLSANFKDYDFSKLPNEQKSKSDEFFKTIAFCEIESLCHKILNRHYPGIKIYDDVTKITKQDLENQKIDIITGGFPCQDLSIAGKMAGLNGKRSGLFYEMLRIAEFTRAKYILFENTPELIRNKNYFGIFTQELRLRGYEYRAFYYELTSKGIKDNVRISLPTPLKSDQFALSKFSLSLQMLHSKTHQQKLYPYIIDTYGERKTAMKTICQIYEKMMGYPVGYTELEC